MSDFISGAFVGIVQTFVGHPFDTAKVLLQNKTPLKGLSFFNFYRGWKFPLVSGTFFNFTVFPIYERTYNYTNSSILSGVISGVAVTPIVYIFDIGKIKQQTFQPLKLEYFTKNKGFYATFTREIIAMPLFFSSYHYFKNNGLDPFFAGGLAGLINWTGTYPIDVIRSRQISQNISVKDAINQKKLWSGYSVCALRSVIVNSVSFKTYEIIKHYIDSKVYA
jgi:hypothetical protein